MAVIIFPADVLTKVMVALGWSLKGRPEDSIEIIDLSSEKRTCRLFPKVPHKIADAVAGLLQDGTPIICGAKFPKFRSACRMFKGGKWVTASSLTLESSNFAMVMLPTGEMLLTGGDTNSGEGKSERLRRTDILLLNGTWKNAQMDLPISTAYHCMVLADNSTVMVIGGHQSSQPGQRTFKLSPTETNWKEGPALINKRASHGCSKIPSSRMSRKESIIVAGGWNKDWKPQSTVEILDAGSDKWRLGPELPEPLQGVSMVRHPDGGVVLIGGSNNGTYSDALYYLPHAGPGAQWEKLPQKLATGRDYQIAVLVPDEILESCIED